MRNFILCLTLALTAFSVAAAELSIDDVLSDNLAAAPAPAANETPASAASAASAPAPAPDRPLTVNKIYVRGGYVTENEVKDKMGTREGMTLDKRILEEDFQRLYRLGKFADVQIKQELVPGSDDRVNVTVLLREKDLIKRIAFVGNQKFKANKLLEMVKSKSGERYDEGQAARDARNIENEYKTKLYYFAKVEVEPEPFEDGVKLTYRIDEGGQIWVRDVIFRGNYRFTDATLRTAMKTRKSSFFTRGQINRRDFEQDLERLRLFYQSNGYLDVTVTERPFQLTAQDPGTGWFGRREAYIYIDVDEGEQYRVGAVDFEGNMLVSSDDLRGVVKTMPGKIFNPIAMVEDAQKIKETYGLYPSSRYFTVVVPERILTEQSRVVDVLFRIRESEQVMVEEVQIVGNVKTQDDVIRRNVEVYPGELLDTRRFNASKRNLDNLNYFNADTLTVEALEGSSPERAKVVINVEEVQTGKVTAGFGVSSADPFSANLGIEQRNFDFTNTPSSLKEFLTGKSFIGGGQYAAINGSLGTKSFNTGFDFNNPWVFHHPVNFGFGPYWRGYEWDEYTDRRLGAYVTVGHKLWNPNLRFNLTYRLENVDMAYIHDSASYLIKKERGTHTLSSIAPSITWDSRDNAFDPEKGEQASLTYKHYGLGGDYNFWSLSARAQIFYPFFTDNKNRNWYLSARTEMTTMDILGNTDHIPVYEMLYAGGIGSVRGWKNNNIGPRDGDSQIGGKTRQTNSLEVFAPIYDRLIKGSFFFDVGAVDTDSFSFGNGDKNNGLGYRASVGFGLHVKTPVSPMPIRLYFPIPLNQQNGDHVEWVQFAFGAMF
ncbi:outer membrane protein assembly factor BamA [Planctomycetales bacterium]|nr:outer membrane protein assembly factor BamA [Planctomycetales bacterium]